MVADRLAGLEYEDGILAWRTARDLAVAVALDGTKRACMTIGVTARLLLMLHGLLQDARYRDQPAI